ncbi:histidinol-phosphate aminotransferase [Lactococcus cremoris subsp. cremoris TIFN7]|uniref:histidinol-phosphate transaminase n=1 Tax=Lactococcus lactis subsp. cremoris TaxID=1359 RepID=UPI00038B9CAD|nr:histidinol-phosphate transaminase [Lactococcus cremoris]EQC87991.1 histidinol-phosphate aminotransferase [Lactococcus cremoris subsp. cremoris TIFN7]
MSWQNNLRSVSPYIAGEQPELTDMIKLNTNENPYPPSLQVQKVIEDFKSENLRLYPSTDAKFLRKDLAEYHHLNTDQVFIGNGSDEVLSLSFLTFFNGQRAILMPDISYSFYPIYCELYRIPYQKIPLADDFSLSVNSYFQENGGIVIANPNAPTGMAISLQEIEEILQNNQDSIVLIDEAYIDFGGESCLPLLEKFDNLVVVQTFSKSRSLAGIRLGIAFGSAEAIAQLYDVKNSFNSYPIDSLAQKIGEASLNDETYFQKSVSKIITTRENFKNELIKLGFQVTDSKTNFVFVHHPKIDATTLFKVLYEAKIIVRHWNQARISDWLRITIGTDREMNTVIQFLKEYLKNKEKSY